jgi:glycosyltransferase involved in cell wall biosynthesis
MAGSAQVKETRYRVYESREMNDQEAITKARANKYRVLVISPHYLTFAKGLIEATSKSVSSMDVLFYHNRLTELSRLLPARGNLISRARRTTLRRLFDNKGIPKNVRVHAVNGFFGTLDRMSTSHGDRIFATMKKKIMKEQIKFEIIHAHFLWPCGYVAARLSREFKVPLVLTAHGYDIYQLPFIDDGWRKRIETILNSATYATTVSQSNLACIRKLDVRTPVEIIPNGFDEALFHPMDKTECRRRLNLPLDKKIILTVGNLTPEKNYGCLIESIEEIKAKRNDFLCVLIGTGGLRTELQLMIREKGLTDNIILAGGKPHDEIPKWMNSCDVFALSSLMEGNPTVLFEALACGIPFVGTKVGGIPDIITSDDYGLLCSADDAPGLAKMLLSALDKKWDSEKIARYSKNYTWDIIAEKMISIYDRSFRQ